MRDEIVNDLAAALREMLAAHSNENIGVNASMRRIKAKERAREVLALVERPATNKSWSTYEPTKEDKDD